MLKKFPLRTKKLLAVLVAVSVIGTASVSEAWVAPVIRVLYASWKACPPEVKAQIASAAVHVGVFVTGALMYSLKASGDGSHKADATNIKRTGDVTWIDLKDGKTVKQSDATAKVSTSTLKNGAKSNPVKYPQLATAANKNAVPLDTNIGSPGDSNIVVGQKIKCPDGTLGVVTSISKVSYGMTKLLNPSSIQSYSSNVLCLRYSDPVTTTWWGGWYQIILNKDQSAIDNAPIIDADDSEFASNIRNGAPENVYSDYYGEIDDFIQSNPNVVQFVDSTDNITPAVPEYASLSQQAVVAAEDNTNSASETYASAQSAATNARARSNADPTNAALANAADQAERDALAAKQKLDEAYAAQIAAETAAQKEDGAKSSVGSDGSHDAYGVPGERDFGSRISSFINNIRNSALFSLPSRILGDVPGGCSPVQSINMGATFGTHTLDWSKFDPVWTVLRAVFLICMGVACVKIVSRGGAG